MATTSISASQPTRCKGETGEMILSDISFCKIRVNNFAKICVPYTAILSVSSMASFSSAVTAFTPPLSAITTISPVNQITQTTPVSPKHQPKNVANGLRGVWTPSSMSRRSAFKQAYRVEDYFSNMDSLFDFNDAVMEPTKPTTTTSIVSSSQHKQDASPVQSTQIAQPSQLNESFQLNPQPNSSHVNQPTEPKLEADALSALPSRLSPVHRLSNPCQFQSQVLEETSSLVVVRFYSDACPTCRATSPLFRRWSRYMEQREQDYLESSLVGYDEEDRLVDMGQVGYSFSTLLSTPSSSKNLNGFQTQSQTESAAVPMAVKFLEMPLTKSTSSFLKHTLQVDQLPYCQLYHPQLGLVEEQLVVNKGDFKEFVTVVDDWSKRDCIDYYNHNGNLYEDSC